MLLEVLKNLYGWRAQGFMDSNEGKKRRCSWGTYPNSSPHLYLGLVPNSLDTSVLARQTRSGIDNDSEIYVCL